MRVKHSHGCFGNLSTPVMRPSSTLASAVSLRVSTGHLLPLGLGLIASVLVNSPDFEKRMMTSSRKPVVFHLVSCVLRDIIYTKQQQQQQQP
ncbi:hypothetical protein MUK42_36831 [Musa troglodytarum]|uniref:Uncharacterized protein n=1 Tax=Musa troglodytarum TaxID=320322 RepID=A0A9E7FHE9_9LILI|nr:hypothetical protein MUK42_36831 [Musa troglodytarum]